MKRFLKSCICFVLCTIMMVMVYPAIHAEGEKKYVSDVKLFWTHDNDSDDSDRAKKALKDNGYTVVPYDLNQGTTDGFCYLGYKTTTDRQKAITDLRVMDMDGGYMKSNATEVLEGQLSNKEHLISSLTDAVREFRNNYYNGSPAAIYAMRILEKIIYDDFNMSMAQAIKENKIGTDQFKQMVMFSESDILIIVSTALLVGCADYNTSDLSDTWAKRVSAKSYSTDDYAGDPGMFDRAYYFYESIRNTFLAIRDAEEKAPSERTDGDKALLSFKEDLNEIEITFDDETFGLSDFLWDVEEAEDIVADWCYPIYNAMTPGQRGLVAEYGIQSFASSLTNTHEHFESANAFFDEKVGAETIKVFGDVDRDAAKGEVSLTNETLRKNALENGKMEEIYRHADADKMIKYSLLVSAGAGAIAGAATITLGATLGISALAGCTLLSSMTGVLIGMAIASAVLGVIAAGLTIAALLVWGLLELGKLLTDKYEINHSPMPRKMIDTVTFPDGSEGYVRYNLVTEPDGNEADLNCRAEKKWLAMYYTKDERLGTPILADTFKVQHAKSTPPEGYTPVRLFGSRMAVNTNLHNENDNLNGIYVFYKADGKEYDFTLNKDKPYILALRVFSGDNQWYVQREIEDATGYEAFDRNLTPGNGYTYLAFQRTGDAANAIKDIRVSFHIIENQVGGSYYIGNVPYSSADYVAGKGLTILYSNHESVGSPILADSLYVTDYADMDSHEYVPVCPVAGGPAFNMNLSMFREEDTQAPEKVFMYYKQAQSYYDSEKTYVSGIARITVMDDNKNAVNYGYVQRYAAELGYQLIESTNTRDSNYSWSCFGISTTHNYKRAIKNIIIDNQLSFSNETRNGISYQKSPIYFELDWNGDGYKSADPWRYGKDIEDRTDDFFDDNEYDNFIDDYCKKYTSNVGILTVPATTPDEAILLEHFSIKKENSATTSANWNAEKVPQGQLAHTFAADFWDLELPGKVSNGFYIEYNGIPHPLRGKYVKSIVVGEKHIKSNASDQSAKMSMFAAGADTYVGKIYLKDGDAPAGDYHHIHVGLETTDSRSAAITDVKLVYVYGTPQKELVMNGVTYRLQSGENNISFQDNSSGIGHISQYAPSHLRLLCTEQLGGCCQYDTPIAVGERDQGFCGANKEQSHFDT